jgi:small-conductance mechanosensitive channel
VFGLLTELTRSYWHLMLAASMLYLFWRLGTRLVGQRPLADHFPRVTAALDVLILPLVFLLLGSLATFANGVVGIPGLDPALHQLTLLSVHLATGWALARLIDVSLFVHAEDTLGQPVPKLIVGLVYVLLLFLSLTLFLWQQGYSFAGVWVSTGVAAAVLGLALQKTLGDLFSGIALSMERPFRIGDWLELSDGTVGQVIDLNWRATRLRRWDNAVQVVPNARMAGDSIKNLGGDNRVYAPWYFVQIPAEVDPRFASSLLLDAARRCESVLEFPNPVVRLADASRIPYSYMVWVHLKNYPAMFRGREELYREIHTGLQQAGIDVAPEVKELRTRRARIPSSDQPTIARALKDLDIGGALSDEELTELSARSEYRYFDTGRVLLAEGAVSDAMYIIAGGLVDACIRLPDGSQKVVETLGPGEQFGITEMLTAEPSFLEYRANTDVTLIRIDLETVPTVLGARKDLVDRLAATIERRLDAAEAARVASRQPARRLTLRDIRLGVERRLRRPAGRSRVGEAD